MRKWEVPALIPIICSLLLCACMPNIESKSPDPVEADKEEDSSADQKIKKQKDKKQKDNKAKWRIMTEHGTNRCRVAEYLPWRTA